MNLLRLFEFYLMAMFVIGTVRRFELYQAMAQLGLRLVRRYQKLFGVVRDQSISLLTWSTIIPAAVTLALWAMQSILTRLVFPHAQLTFAELLTRWWFPPVVLVPVVGMLAVDGYFLFRVGQIDVKETEKYFGQAESWLGTWKAKAVRAATLGYVDPDKMVLVEVQKAMTAGERLIHVALWWSAVQTAWRVGVGSALWLVYAVGSPR
ncbi:MAG: hypothetical protein K1X57_13110 [Gemmataceae bacterium]|nr:hypothetical protein [Gemmataceae bacterium]